MNILVTGANGFIGKNLCLELERINHEVLKYDVTSSEIDLINYINKADFVIHLAGVNRPLSVSEFYDGNANFTIKLIELLEKQNRQIPVLISSSIQASKDNDYGKSKKMAEDEIFKYGERTGSNTYVYRLANAFGKWCKPNYNSVIATFCYNIANELPITINDASAEIPFVYIDDIVDEFIKCLSSGARHGLLEVHPIYEVTVGKLAEKLEEFKNSRMNNNIPKMSDDFTKKLYSTYLTYLTEDKFKYPLKMNVDARGSFTEFVKTAGYGQVSVNISEPGIVKGNHWHNTKNEKFLVVSGYGVVRFRKIGCTEILEYKVSGNVLEVIDIPPGYTHNIENLGQEKLITVMWCNELFDEQKPDTIFEKV